MNFFKIAARTTFRRPLHTPTTIHTLSSLTQIIKPNPENFSGNLIYSRSFSVKSFVNTFVNILEPMNDPGFFPRIEDTDCSFILATSRSHRTVNCQIVASSAFTAFIAANPSVANFVFSNSGIYPGICVAGVGSLLAMFKYKHKFPQKAIAVGAFTLSQSLIMGPICAAMDVSTAIGAILMNSTLSGTLTWSTFLSTVYPLLTKPLNSSIFIKMARVDYVDLGPVIFAHQIGSFFALAFSVSGCVLGTLGATWLILSYPMASVPTILCIIVFRHTLNAWLSRFTSVLSTKLSTYTLSHVLSFMIYSGAISICTLLVLKILSDHTISS